MTIAVTASVMHEQNGASSRHPGVSSKNLPDDVTMFMKSFDFHESGGSLKIDIKGDRIVHRGREILGLRSNIVTAVYLENIKGTIRLIQGKGIMEFAADEAEWDTDASAPLVLRRNVAVTINNKHLDYVKNARLYLRRGILVTTGKHREVFRLTEL
jgi:hypothetical protein